MIRAVQAPNLQPGSSEAETVTRVLEAITSFGGNLDSARRIVEAVASLDDGDLYQVRNWTLASHRKMKKAVADFLAATEGHDEFLRHRQMARNALRVHREPGGRTTGRYNHKAEWVTRIVTKEYIALTGNRPVRLSERNSERVEEAAEHFDKALRAIFKALDVKAEPDRYLRTVLADLGQSSQKSVAERPVT